MASRLCGFGLKSFGERPFIDRDVLNVVATRVPRKKVPEERNGTSSCSFITFCEERISKIIFSLLK